MDVGSLDPSAASLPQDDMMLVTTLPYVTLNAVMTRSFVAKNAPQDDMSLRRTLSACHSKHSEEPDPSLPLRMT
jgi:hypothetical protein